MYESPFQTYADLLINGWNPSARYLQSFVLSMLDGNKYKFSADELSSLTDDHFSIFIELAEYFRSEGGGGLPFRDVCAKMIERRPDYRELPVGLHPFPDPEFVFVPDQSDLARHLHPLFTIDLSMVNSEWSGSLYMLSPLEPAEHRLVGYATRDTDYQSPLLHTNWIGFKIEDRRYRLMGDPRYFFLHEENIDLPDPYPEARSELLDFYEQQNAAFAAARATYNETGYLFNPDKLVLGARVDSRDLCPFVEQIGGDVDIGQVWAGSMPLYIAESRPNGITPVYPRSPSGNPFYHVASAPANSYQQMGADKIIMFYEPVEQLVLFTFHWERFPDIYP
ncbi:MAG: hypothetical protein RSG92_16375 [Pseudomonas sp.]